MKYVFILLSFIFIGNVAVGQNSTKLDSAVIADSISPLKNGYTLIDKKTDSIECFYLKGNGKRVELMEYSIELMRSRLEADADNYFILSSAPYGSCPTVFLSIYSKKEAIPVYKSEGHVLDDDTLRNRIALYDADDATFVVYNLANNTYARYNAPKDVYSDASCPSFPDFEDVKLSGDTLTVHYTDTAQHPKIVTYSLWKGPEIKY